MKVGDKVMLNQEGTCDCRYCNTLRERQGTILSITGWDVEVEIGSMGTSIFSKETLKVVEEANKTLNQIEENYQI